jgi:hypothetical protein
MPNGGVLERVSLPGLWLLNAARAPRSTPATKFAGVSARSADG